MPQKREMRHARIKKILGVVLFISLLISTVYSFVRFLMAPGEILPNMEHEKTKGDYLLMFIQCWLGIAVMSLPSILAKKWKMDISNPIYILYYIFLYCAVFLGEVFDFYYVIPHWDTMLHTLSGAMLGALGFILVDILNGSDKVKVQLSPGFVALFAFCFSMACGAVWEIYEYTVDTLMQLNMQKYMTEHGAVLSGRDALKDTMEDIICDALAAGVVSLIGYFSIRKQKKMSLNKE